MGKPTTSNKHAKRDAAAPAPGPLRAHEAVARRVKLDGWANVFTGLGMAGRDKRASTEFAQTYKLEREELEILYHGDDVVARICDLIPDEMLREWIEIPADVDGKIADKLDALGARDKFGDALTWARLYGGSVVLVGANDGQRMDKPLNVERVKSLDYLTVLDRHEIYIATTYVDPRAAKFGDPEMYEIRTVSQGSMMGFGARVHESRIIRFDGARTSRQRKRENQGWHDSVIQKVFDVIRDFNASFGSSANLIQDFAQAIFKIKNLADMLAADEDKLVLKRLALLDLSRSVGRAVPLDADSEDFDRKATPVTGLSDLLDRQAQRLSAASDIPITKLLGVSPGGLNSTGDSDQRNLNNTVRAQQSTKLRRPLGMLINIIARLENVKPSDGQDAISWEFRPLWQPTEKEVAETRKTQAETDCMYIDRGVVDSAEIAVSRFGGDKYSAETMLDNDARSDGEDSEANKEDVDMTGVVSVIEKVNAKSIPRDSGIELLISVYGYERAEADRLMGSAGVGPSPAELQAEIDSKAAANAADDENPQAKKNGGDRGFPQKE